MAAAPLQLWHRRLAHYHYGGVRELEASKAVSGMRVTTYKQPAVRCHGCAQGKFTRLPFPMSSTVTTGPMQLVHTDVIGPMSTQSKGGAYYLVSFIDDYSRKVWGYAIHSKDEVFGRFRDWLALGYNESGQRLQILRSDRGGEYCSRAMHRWMHKRGIKHQRTMRYTAQQNGVAERFNRTVIEAVRCMLHAADLGHEWWAEAVRHAIWVRNRVLCSGTAVEGKTPEECWSGVKPDIEGLRVFGCMAYVHVPDETRTKLDPKAHLCIHLGMEENVKGWRFWDVEEQKLVRSRDAVFMEDVSWGMWQRLQQDEQQKVQQILQQQMQRHRPPSSSSSLPIPIPLPVPSMQGPSPSSPPPPPSHHHSPPSSSLSSPSRSPPQPSASSPPPLVHSPSPSPSPPPVDASAPSPPAAVVTYRRRAAPTSDEVREPYTTRSGRVVRAPVYLALATEEDLCDEETVFVTLPQEPRNYREAVASEDADQWLAAMRDELQSHAENHTYEYVDPPRGVKLVDNMWIFKVKQKADGSMDKRKARLVARGFTQVKGVNYDETFAPVSKFTTLRTLLSMAAVQDLHVHQMDVKTAFLNGTLEEEIYMRQPEGFDDGSGRVLRLRRSLYGLKQSPRAWYQRIDGELLRHGFIRCESDHALYVQQQGERRLYLLLYVDDLLLASDDMGLLEQTKGMLSSVFKMTDMGPVSYYLGFHVSRDRGARSLSLDQHKYLRGVLERFKMEECKPVGTPVSTSTKLVSGEAHELLGEQEQKQYQSLVGSLMYAMVGTRPDLAYAVGILSQFLSRPTDLHWQTAKRVLRYVKGTLDRKLEYRPVSQSGVLYGYTDSDWAGCVETRKSTGGFVYLLNGGAVSWMSKKQEQVATSSCHAEYMALNRAGREAVWLRRLLQEMGYGQAGPTTIHVDNQSAINLAKNPVGHGRSKHIEIQWHWIREIVENGEVRLQQCATSLMAADFLTKALAKDKFLSCLQRIGMED